MKLVFFQSARLRLQSPSMRRVWIEIVTKLELRLKALSPSMRRVWIEIKNRLHDADAIRLSPSMRRVWIEIRKIPEDGITKGVTLHAEGVD